MSNNPVIHDLVLKLQLVASGGIMLAELPTPVDETQSQLSGGIMTALMAFSKEVHKKEIEALSFADRSVIFIPIHDFVIVAEISTSVSKENLTQLITEFKIRTEFYFVGIESDRIGLTEAEDILKQIYSSDWLEETITGLGYQRPLIDEKKVVLKFKHDSLEYSVLDGEDNPDLHKKIIGMVTMYGINGPLDVRFCSGFIMIPSDKKAVFLVHLKEQIESYIGMIFVSEEKASQLFRLLRILQNETSQYFNSANNDSMIDLIGSLVQLRDHNEESREQIKSPEAKPLHFLEQYIKNVEKIIPKVIIGEPILIIGDEDIVDEVIMGLHHFGEHMVIPHIRWLTGGDTIGYGLTGISQAKYDDLKHANKIPDQILCVNTNDKKFEGKKLGSNNFIKDLYKRSKNLPRSQSKEIIKNQLHIVVSFAMTGTSYVFQDKKGMLSSLQDLKVSIKDNSQFELIQELIESANPWIESIVKEVAMDDVWI